MVESNRTKLVTRHIAGKGEMGSTDTLSVHNCTRTGLVERRETVHGRGPPKPGAAGVAVAVSPMAQRGCAVMVMLRRRDDR